jgi:hypothetical protein
VLEEALGGRLREIFSHHQGATLGELVATLTGDSHWSVLRGLPVSSVLQPSGRAAPRQPVARAQPVRARRSGGRAGNDEVMLDKLVQLIENKPGLRSEQIQKELGLPPKLVKAGLAKLREEHRVRTIGERRAMTYAVA